MVDNWGHFGGLVGGAAAAYYFGPRLYLLELPTGGSTIADRPIFRLPPSMEAIPYKVNEGYQRITRRIQVNQHKFDLPNKPWRMPQSNY